MKTTVERVREICKEKGIPISKIERDLGFGNGYLNPQKAKEIKLDRAVAISKYLSVSLGDLLGYDDDSKTPALTSKGGLSEKDIRLIQWFRSLPQGKQKAILDSQDAPEDLF